MSENSDVLSDRLQRRVFLMTVCSGAAVAALGLVVLIGWTWGIERLLLIANPLPAMVPLTALLLLMSGLSLISFSIESPKTRLAGKALAGVVAAISGLTVAEHLFGFRTGAEFLVFGNSLFATTNGTGTGRMGLHAASVFLLCALALLSLDLDSRRGYRPAIALSLIATSLALVAVFGFIFGLRYLYGGAVEGGMALHSAVGLTVLSVGILCCRPSRFPVSVFSSPGPGGVLARRLVPVLAATPFIFGLMRLLGERTGTFSANFGLAITTTVSTVFLILLLAFVSSSLNRSDEERRRAQGRFIAAFRNAPTGKALVDLSPGGSSRITEVNPALCSILRRNEAEILDRDFAQLVDPVFEGVREQLLAGMVFRSGSSIDMEVPLLRHDQSVVWTNMTASVVDDGGDGDTHVLVQVSDITQRKELHGRLEHLAHHDGLTGLYNRRRFDEELARHVETCRRYGATGAVALVDLDNFKSVNDTLGHAVGDRVIRKVSHVLEDRLRSTDIVARLGGDEFAVLFSRGSAEEVESVCTELIDLVRRGLEEENLTVPVTCSIGVSAFDSARLSVDEALMEADVALYQAKDAGKARVVSYSLAMASRAHGLYTAQRLRAALENGSFRLELQPVVDLRSRAIAQNEVLLRINDGGPDIPPDVLFMIARRLGLALELDRWVLRTALCDHSSFEELSDECNLSLNLSVDSISDRTTVEWLRDLIASTKIRPQRLIFEISESSALANVQQAAQLARMLHESGCRIAVDDFGSALVSLAELTQISFDFVKIDGSLVNDLAHQPQNQAVIRAVSEMAGELGKLTIGEFVEDEATALLLCDLGVQYGQGFHMGSPTAAALSD